jgi:hypothetical protein
VSLMGDRTTPTIRRSTIAALVAATALGACGGGSSGGSDEANARATLKSFMTSGKCSALTEKARKLVSGETDEAKCDKVLAQGSKPKNPKYGAVSVSGNTATLKFSDAEGSTTVTEVKQGGHWLIDNTENTGKAPSVATTPAPAATSTGPTTDTTPAPAGGAAAPAIKAAYEATQKATDAGISAVEPRMVADAKSQDIPALKTDLASLRDLVFAYDAALRKIPFANAQATAVNTVLDADRTVIADLDAAGQASGATALGHLLTDRIGPDLTALTHVSAVLRAAL